MRVAFAKYEGLGNDFVIVDARSQALQLTPAHALTICDRHRGVGADGVLLIEHARESKGAAMRVINADGSRPEMCGNGIRCVALHLVRSAERQAGVAFEIETDAGPHTCHVVAAQRESAVNVWMRAASLEPADIPVQADHVVLDEFFHAPGTRVRLSCVSMGNPHAVTFDDISEAARASLGPVLEKHPRFPRGANIGFARVLGLQAIELAVWERGVGFTQACGTGACACAVAAVETKRATRHTPITLRLPGGELQIVVAEPSDRISMTGPARHVFEGSLEL
jgi:diaminopimelate epimerase